MKKALFALIALACLVTVWTSTDAQAFQIITNEMIEKEIVTETDFIRTADNFIILLDEAAARRKKTSNQCITPSVTQFRASSIQREVYHESS